MTRTSLPARVLSRTIAAALVTAALALSACNTTEGAGKDIKAAGKGIEDAAARNK